jgi:hypothetical protein
MVFRSQIMTILIFSFIQFCCSQSEVWASSDEEIRNAIQVILKSRHPTENGEWWSSLGPNAPKIIMDLYSTDKSIYHKVRLMDALAWFDDAAAANFMKKEGQNQTNQVLKNSAINSLIRAQGLKEKDFISKVLKDRNPHTRETAAMALIDLEDPKAGALVESYLKKEKVPWIASKIHYHRKSQVSRKQKRLPAQIQRH